LKVIENVNGRYTLAKEIQSVAVPSTIQDMIMARVDSLPEGAKELLQTGSVIEREFRYELIKRVTSLPEQVLLSHLSILKDSELLYERGVYPKSTYIFKHALTREVVYNSILTKKKKSLHEEIGNAIGELYHECIDEHYGVVAEHYITAENYVRGAEYSKLAAKKAEKAGSFTNAISYTESRIGCLERLPRTEDVETKIIDSRTTLGLYYMQTDRYIKAKEAVDPIFELTLERDYKRRVAQIYIILGAYMGAFEEDLLEAIKYHEEALKIAEQVNDIPSLVLVNWTLGGDLSMNCEFEKAFQHIEKALSINTALNILWAIAIMKSLQSFCCYNPQGKIHLAYQTSEESVKIAEESGDTYSKSLVYPQHGHSCYRRGFFKEAKEHVLKGVDFCEMINSNMWNSLAQLTLGETYFELGEYQKSLAHHENAIRLLELNRSNPSWINLFKICVAKAKVMMDEKVIDLEMLYLCEKKNKVKMIESDIQRNIGEILLSIDEQHSSIAEEWIKKAIETDKSNVMMWHLGRDYALYAELHKRKGDRFKARESLGKAIEILKECGADGWVEKYEKELVAIS
jgi:tetratricopeptide (TPR) repeat protein